MEKPKGQRKGKRRNPGRKFHSDRIMGIRSNGKNHRRRVNISKTKRQSLPSEF